MANENTLRAAAEMEITYVESRFRAADTIVPNGVRRGDGSAGAASEEAFSLTNARRSGSITWTGLKGMD